MDKYESSIFDLSPIPMWLQDHSEVHAQFEIWRSQGVTDLRTFLKQDISRVILCAMKIKNIRVNKKALEIYQAKDIEEVERNIHIIFQNQMFESYLSDLVALWEGKTEYSNTSINHTVKGHPLDIKIRGVVLPGAEKNLERILLTTEDISDYQNARRLAESSFKHSPTSLWVEDYSRVKKRFDRLKAMGMEDFRGFLDHHPEFISMCIDDIIYLDVNQATLDLFKAPNKKELFDNISKVFIKETIQSFKEQFIELWDGNLSQQRETTTHTLDGLTRHLLLQFSIFPGHENDWRMVQVALTDITARKNAENYLEYWRQHDVLTNLKNRSFFAEELKRLENIRLRPVSAIFIDINGLKKSNDNFGHDYGDTLLKRLGHILSQLIEQKSYSASRVGGDEFVILLPNANQDETAMVMKQLQSLVHSDNQYHIDQLMSLSIGEATTEANESIQSMLRRADLIMYQMKRKYYHGTVNTCTDEQYRQIN